MGKKGRLAQRSEYLLYRSAAAAIGAISETRLRSWGTRLGRVAGKVVSRRTALARANVARVFPERTAAECEEIVRRCWEHFGRVSLEYLRVQSTPLEEIAARCDLVHREILDDAIQMGRGVLLLSAHFGSWEVGAQLLALLESGVTTVARPLDNELLERDLSRSRGRTGIELIDKRDAARSLVRSLRAGKTLVLLPDQAVRPHEGLLVPFLGRNAWTTPGPAKLALKFRTPIVFVFCLPDGERHRIEFAGPILVDELPVEIQNVETITLMINNTLSRWILRDPHLWLWMHDRWKGAS